MEDNKQSLDLEKLFSLDGLKIIETKEELQKNGKLLVTLFTELKNRPSRICPECDHKNVYSNGYGERTIDDLPMFGKDAKVVLTTKDSGAIIAGHYFRIILTLLRMLVRPSQTG